MFWNIFYDLCVKRGTKPNPVGKQLGIASSTITQWKQGALPSSETLLKLVDYFGVSADYLLGLTDNPTLHSDDLSADEKRALALFARLDDFDKGIIIGRMEAAIEAEKYKQDGLSGEKAM